MCVLQRHMIKHVQRYHCVKSMIRISCIRHSGRLELSVIPFLFQQVSSHFHRFFSNIKPVHGESVCCQLQGKSSAAAARIAY